MKRALPARLLALTPGELVDGGERELRELLGRAESACEAGLQSILLREPRLSDRATLALARELRRLLGPRRWLGLHDRVHLAEASGADAVHLGFRSLAPSAARGLLPDSIAIGFSAHAGDPLEAWSDCDYLLLGPVFETPSKRGLKAPLGLAGVRAELARATAPVWAIGGVDASNAEQVLPTKVAGIAVLRSILGSGRSATEVRVATHDLLARVDAERAGNDAAAERD